MNCARSWRKVQPRAQRGRAQNGRAPVSADLMRHQFRLLPQPRNSQMPKLLLSLIIVACTLLTGCAGTAARVQTDYRLAQGEKVKLQLTAPPTATEEGLQILRDRLTTQLSNNGLLAPTSDGSARTLEVVVTNYSLRHGAARAMLGIMAGTDNLQST